MRGSRFGGPVALLVRALPSVGEFFAIVGQSFSFVRGPLPLVEHGFPPVGGPVAVIGEPLAPVRGLVALVGQPLTFVGDFVAPVGGRSPLARHSPLVCRRRPGFGSLHPLVRSQGTLVSRQEPPPGLGGTVLSRHGTADGVIGAVERGLGPLEPRSACGRPLRWTGGRTTLVVTLRRRAVARTAARLHHAPIVARSGGLATAAAPDGPAQVSA